MAKVRLRVELNKGRRGIRLGKLARIAQETLDFLSRAHRDAELPGDPQEWLAVNFDNNSVDFDCEALEDVELLVAERANRVFHTVMTNDRTSDFAKRVVSDSTRRQYSQIAALIEPDERVIFKLFNNGGAEPVETHDLTRSMAHDIDLQLPSTADYYGEIQGTIHALYKDDKPKRVVVRELSSRRLIDCFFDDAIYGGVIDALEDQRGVVFVEGEIRENLVTGIIEYVSAKDIRLAPVFDEARFNSLIGSAPELTGALSTEEYVERFRASAGST